MLIDCLMGGGAVVVSWCQPLLITKHDYNRYITEQKASHNYILRSLVRSWVFHERKTNTTPSMHPS